MASIRELYENYRGERNPGVPGEGIIDLLGVRLAWLLLKTKITPNQITIAGTILGFIGIYFITMMNGIYSLAGYILVLSFAIFDYADGVVARYHKSVSFKGKYYDALGHFITPLLFVAAGTYIFRNTQSLTPLLLGVTATILNLFIDLNAKLPSIITGTKMKQLYLSSNKYPTTGGIRFFFKRKLIVLNKNLTFGIHIIFFFLITHVLNIIWPQKGLQITQFMLIGFVIIFAVTFLYQIRINSVALGKLDKKTD